LFESEITADGERGAPIRARPRRPNPRRCRPSPQARI